MRISKDAQSVLSSAGAGAKEYVLNQGGFGRKLTSGEASRLLAGFKPQTDNVFSTSNINQASVSPQVAPADLLGVRNQINNELGIPQLQTKYQDVFGQLRRFDVATEEQSRQIQEQPLVMSKIRGQKATARGQRASERLGLATEADVARSALLAAQQEAGARFNISSQDIRDKKNLILQFPGAGITFGDSTNAIADKIDSWQKNEEKRIKKDAEKSAIEGMFAQQFGYIPNKKSTKWMNKKLKKAGIDAKELAKEARDMELEKFRLDMENSRSIIANRGKTKQKQVDPLKGFDVGKNEDVAVLINQDLSAGTDWSTIASTLFNAGVDIKQGSFADKYLRYQFLGEDNPLNSEE